MNTRSPIKGLMIYSFHSASGNLIIIFLVCLVMVVGLLITGNGQIYFWLGVMAINAPVYIVIAGIAANAGVMWKRFQLAMPVKRSDLVSSQYLLVIIASIIGEYSCAAEPPVRQGVSNHSGYPEPFLLLLLLWLCQVKVEIFDLTRENTTDLDNGTLV